MGDGIPGFGYTTVEVGPTAYRPGVAGSGPAVLLLHGFPQTHYCWHEVAPGARRPQHTVVVCDLKGYGASRSAPGGPLGEGYDKRTMAAELREVMARIGHERFSVVGHDRGGRVAYRMALDHPDAVERLAVLNIVPTVDQFERMAAEVALDYFPWYLLAQPAPFAERVVSASAEYVVRHLLESWAAAPGAITPEAADRYARAFTAEAISGDLRRVPRGVPSRPSDGRRGSRGGGADRVPGPRALGRRGGIDVRRTAARLAAVGRRGRGRPARVGALRAGGGRGRPRGLAGAVPPRRRLTAR